jgi:hypothetical protein
MDPLSIPQQVEILADAIDRAIKDRTPLTRVKLSGKLPRAQVFAVRGMTTTNQAWE